MDNLNQPDALARQVTRWAERQDSIRAALLTSTRANPTSPLDIFSDYDVVLVVRDIHPYFEDRAWLGDFGQVLVAYFDPIYTDPDYGVETFVNVIQYEDGLKIDFSLWPVELLQRIAGDAELPPYLDDGYTILFDKDGLTEDLQTPTYQGYIPTPPTRESYLTEIENFFSDAPYVAKNLWRDELLPAKYCLDTVMKQNYLRRMLEWRVEIDHDWSVKPGSLGKWLKKRLPAETWAELESTYTGAGEEENWEALFKTIDLYRKAAIEVGNDLGYDYPQDLHDRVANYLLKVKGMNHQAVGELARYATQRHSGEAFVQPHDG